MDISSKASIVIDAAISADEVRAILLDAAQKQAIQGSAPFKLVLSAVKLNEDGSAAVNFSYERDVETAPDLEAVPVAAPAAEAPVEQPAAAAVAPIGLVISGTVG